MLPGAIKPTDWQFGCFDSASQSHTIFGRGKTFNEARANWIKITDAAILYVGDEVRE